MDKGNVTVRHLMTHSLMTHLNKTISLVEKVVRSGNGISTKSEERVHDLRTETRRAEVALDLFEGWLPADRIAWLKKQLTRLRHKAGAVRNLDVVLPLLDQAPSVPKKARKWLVHRAEASRIEAIEAMKHECRRVLKHHFKERCRKLKRHFGWRKPAAAPSAKEFSLREIHRHAGKFFSKLELAKGDAKKLHPARIAGRKLRYALELLEDSLAKSVVEATCDRLTTVQDTLGKANDQEFAVTFLNESESECHRKSIAAVLPSAIDSLDAKADEQAKRAIHDVVETTDRVRKLLADLTQKT